MDESGTPLPMVGEPGSEVTVAPEAPTPPAESILDFIDQPDSPPTTAAQDAAKPAVDQAPGPAVSQPPPQGHDHIDSAEGGASGWRSGTHKTHAGQMVQDLALGPIIDRIHGAALDPTQWSGVVADLAKLCGAHTGIIYEFDRVRGMPTVMGTLQIDPSRAQLYEQHYYSVDPWNRHAMSSQIGRVTLTHEFMRDADFQRSEFYRDYLRQSDIFYALGTTVERTPDHMAVFGVQRGHRKGPFSKEAANMVELIAPHLRRAYLRGARCGR